MPPIGRFTTRRLLILTVVFALGFAVLPGRRYLNGFGWQESIDWEAFLLTLFSSVAVFGLSQQIKDLWELRRREQLTADVGAGLWLGVSCRAAVVIGLAACYTHELLLNRRYLDPSRGQAEGYLNTEFSGSLFPDIAWVLLAMVAMAAIPGAVPVRRRPLILGKTRVAVVWLLACLLVFSTLRYHGLIYFLVHLATAGIEAYQPGRFQRPGTFPGHAAEGYAFFWTSCIAAACVPLTLICLVAAARAERWPVFLRALPVTGLTIGLAVTTGYSIWYVKWGLPRASPDLASANLPLTAAGLGFVVIVLIALALILALRLADAQSGASGGLRWCRPRGYSHETRITGLVALLLAAYEIFLYDPRRAVAVYGAVRELIVFRSTNEFWRLVSGITPTWPPTYPMILCLALALLAGCLLFRRNRIQETMSEAVLKPVPPKRFAVLFVLSAWALTSSLFTLAAFTFAWWLDPWYH